MAQNGTENQLTSRQTQAIAALLASRTVGEAAKAADVGQRTLHRWLADDAFRQALNEAEAQAIAAAARRLVQLTESALDVVESVLADPDIHPATRLKAVDTVLANLLRLRELGTIEDRLAKLEGSL